MNNDFFGKTKLVPEKLGRGSQARRTEIRAGFLERGQHASSPLSGWSGERCILPHPGPGGAPADK